MQGDSKPKRHVVASSIYAHQVGGGGGVGGDSGGGD